MCGTRTSMSRSPPALCALSVTRGRRWRTFERNANRGGARAAGVKSRTWAHLGRCRPKSDRLARHVRQPLVQLRPNLDRTRPELDRSGPSAGQTWANTGQCRIGFGQTWADLEQSWTESGQTQKSSTWLWPSSAERGPISTSIVPKSASVGLMSARTYVDRTHGRGPTEFGPGTMPGPEAEVNRKAPTHSRPFTASSGTTVGTGVRDAALGTGVR